MYTDVYICVYQRIYLLIKSPHTNVFTHFSRVYTFHSLAQQGCVGVFMSFPRNGTLMVRNVVLLKKVEKSANPAKALLDPFTKRLVFPSYSP